uniref:Uncharacterized protein n=1 Tax=Rhizophora mucronata TaxID=61149 RepID=A0A2P2PTT3_RHIMU
MIQASFRHCPLSKNQMRGTHGTEKR